jgi:hypothetical protein
MKAEAEPAIMSDTENPIDVNSVFIRFSLPGNRTFFVDLPEYASGPAR